jgi:hypothetical protein
MVFSAGAAAPIETRDAITDGANDKQMDAVPLRIQLAAPVTFSELRGPSSEMPKAMDRSQTASRISARMSLMGGGPAIARAGVG